MQIDGNFSNCLYNRPSDSSGFGIKNNIQGLAGLLLNQPILRLLSKGQFNGRIEFSV